MTNDELCACIRQELYALQDLKYRAFNSSLIPNIEKQTIIGVRVPEVRKLAKKLFAEIDCFRYFNILPHGYFEENLLHAFMIEKINDFDICIKAAEDFLPYIDNWAVCDSFFPPVFKKQKEKLLPRIPRLIKMMRAWYFATALAKQYESAIVYIKENRLDDWTHNMTIKKAVESRRISAETKSYLKTFRRNG